MTKISFPFCTFRAQRNTPPLPKRGDRGVRLPFFLLFFVFGFTSSEDNTYVTDIRLFHIERSINKNIVCYDLNSDTSGALNKKEPIHVYWINREEHPGQRGELNYVQKELAFGYKVTSVDNNTALLKLNAVKTRPVTLEQSGDQKYVCKTDINGRPAVLRKIYVQTPTGNSLRVEYVEIFGTDFETGMSVSERITP